MRKRMQLRRSLVLLPSCVFVLSSMLGIQIAFQCDLIMWGELD